MKNYIHFHDLFMSSQNKDNQYIFAKVIGNVLDSDDKQILYSLINKINIGELLFNMLSIHDIKINLEA